MPTSTATTQQPLLSRMNRLIGHAESNKKMITDGKYCIDIIHQNLAVISALHKVNEEILSRHLHSCVKKAMQSNDEAKQEAVIKEILEIYEKTKR